MCPGCFWLNRMHATFILTMSICPLRTVTVSINIFWQLAAHSFDADYCIIGGPGIVVEVDKSKLDKRKIIGGIGLRERGCPAELCTLRKRVFIYKVENSSAKTLLAFFQTHVGPDSIIFRVIALVCFLTLKVLII